MHLTSSDGASLHLRILGYQHPGAEPADDEWEANWLLVAGTVRTARGASWSFRDPALTTWEVTDLVSWLHRAAEGAVPLAAGPSEEQLDASGGAVDGVDRPYWWDQLHDAGWLTFVEPNLSFAVTRYRAGLVQLQVGLGAELAPPPHPAEGHAWWPLSLCLATDQLRDAGAALAADVVAHPVR